MPFSRSAFSGYPFERNPDEGFRSQLDDLAKRHPELAETLNNFTQRDRQNRSPNQQHHQTHSTFPRRLPRRFDERFERFGFPFDREDFEQPQPQYQEPQFGGQSSSSREEVPESSASTSSKQEEVPQPQPQRNNIQQSASDSGQKQQQEVINDRGKRSMSAPPAEKTQVNQEPEQPQAKPKMSQNKTNERIIPIHIEGRDEPVLPKSSATPPQHHHHPQQQQPERIFGQRPEQFTQFLNRDQRFNNQHHQNTVPKKEEIPIPVQREPPPAPQTSKSQEHQPQEAQKEAPKQPEPQPPQRSATPDIKPQTPLEQIQAIQKDVSELIAQVEAFTGKPRDKQYLYLDEMLTRNLIKLDNIETHGQDNIRSARKEAIKCIERTISILEAKAAAMAQESQKTVEEKMEVAEQSQPEQEVESKVDVEMKDGESVEKMVEEEGKVECEVKSEEGGEKKGGEEEEGAAAAAAQTESNNNNQKDKKKGKKKSNDKK